MHVLCGPLNSLLCSFHTHAHAHARAHTRTHTCTCTRTRTCTCTHIHMHMHTHTHAHAHTHTHTVRCLSSSHSHNSPPSPSSPPHPSWQAPPTTPTGHRRGRRDRNFPCVCGRHPPRPRPSSPPSSLPPLGESGPKSVPLCGLGSVSLQARAAVRG